MSDVAVSVESLSKLYRVGSAPKQHNNLQEFIFSSIRAPLNRIRQNRAVTESSGDEIIWALRKISFEVKQGEVVGIIGRNGAGKSTLLKILSEITEPSSGRAIINGRVSSLLEVGTGFHPELTGRENVYFNGAILGMKKGEIDQKFDEIVDFSGIEKFLDTPIKRYSSGMKVRLAFSVAAHLEPEVLLIDEVLSVGDAEFRQKSLGKMKNVAQSGRTVLFVSHSMGAVQALCERGIMLKDSQIAVDGTAKEAVSAYLSEFEPQETSMNLSERTDRQGKGRVRLSKIEICDSISSSSTLALGRPARFVFRVTEILPRMYCTFTIYDHLGRAVANFKSSTYGLDVSNDLKPVSAFVCEFDEMLLMPGQYRINVALISNGELQDHIESATLFDVIESEVAGHDVSANKNYGIIYLPHRWMQPRLGEV